MLSAPANLLGLLWTAAGKRPEDLSFTHRNPYYLEADLDTDGAMDDVVRLEGETQLTMLFASGESAKVDDFGLHRAKYGAWRIDHSQEIRIDPYSAPVVGEAIQIYFDGMQSAYLYWDGGKLVGKQVVGC